MALRLIADRTAELSGPYAAGENTGSALFCANDTVGEGYVTPLENRAPSGQLAVVRGASQVKKWVTLADRWAGSRSSIDNGNRSRDGAGTSRAESSAKGLLAVNAPRHHRRHRRVVRAGTPDARTTSLAVAAMTARALTTMTMAPT